eukprot:maker-scaffold_18-snap-gene-1.0-mRNA-1 protein AED:0.00 eAED:0.00 QI:134/1/1/1/1/1/3/184/601
MNSMEQNDAEISSVSGEEAKSHSSNDQLSPLQSRTEDRERRAYSNGNRSRIYSHTSNVSMTSPQLSGVTNDSHIEALLLDPSSQRFQTVAGDEYNSLPTYPLRPSYKEYHFSLRPDSRVVVFDGCPDNPHKPASTPIYQTATFEQPSSSEFGAYDYTRSGNPTRTALEKQVAMLEYAHAAFAFSSGMAALNCVTRLLRPGDTMFLTSDIYGGMHRLTTKVTALYNINIVFIDTWDLPSVEAAFSQHVESSVRLLHMETPSNPLMKITDIRGISDICRRHGCLLSVDSTMMTPLLQQPLNHGADIVIHSMTKFFGGHSDTMGGAVAVGNETLAKQIAFYQNAEGSGLSPFDCWLFLRGIKTMAVRMEKQQRNALQIANWLRKQTNVVQEVYYAGLQPNEREMKGNVQRSIDFKIHSGQANGGGSLLSFVTGDLELSKKIIDALRLFKITVSFGSVNSLVEMPAYLSHASIPDEERTLPVDLIRLSAGIEDANDLLDDLQQAFAFAYESIKKGTKTEPVKKSLKQEAVKALKDRTKPELPQNVLTPSGSALDLTKLATGKKEKKAVSFGSTEENIYLTLDKNNLKLFLGVLLGMLVAQLLNKM